MVQLLGHDATQTGALRSEKFKLLRESVDESWRERILRSGNRNWQDTPNTETETIREERSEHAYNEAMGGAIGPDENLYQPSRQARHQEEPQRRELPKRTRRLPAKIKDYVVETAP